MRKMGGVVAVVVALGGWVGSLEAREKPIRELPKDVWDLAFVWTEPIKQAAQGSRQFDPMSGVWFGLLEGSVKAVERTAGLVLSEDSHDETIAHTSSKTGNALLRYSF